MDGKDAFRSKQQQREAKADISFTNVDLERDCGIVTVACYSQESGMKAVVEVRAWLNPRLNNCLVHFGLHDGNRLDWTDPTKATFVNWPSGLVRVDGAAAQAPLLPLGDNVYGMDFAMPAAEAQENGKMCIEPAVAGMTCVLRTASGNEWIKAASGKDIVARFAGHGKWRGAWQEKMKREAEAKKRAEIEKASQGKEAFRSLQQSQQQPKANIHFTMVDMERDAGIVSVTCFSEDAGAKAVVEVRAWLHPRLDGCIMHFGVLEGQGNSWSNPCKASHVKWPDGLVRVDDSAAQVPLNPLGDNVHGFDISMQAIKLEDNGRTAVEPAIAGIAFVLRTKNGNEWFKTTSGRDAVVRFSATGGMQAAFQEKARREADTARRAAEAAKREAEAKKKEEAEAKKKAEFEKVQQSKEAFRLAQKAKEANADVCFEWFQLEKDCGLMTVACHAEEGGTQATVEVSAWLHPRLGNCILHFGVVGRGSNAWTNPIKATNVKWPAGVAGVGETAAQAPLVPAGDNVHRLEFSMPAKQVEEDGETAVEPAIPGLAFVVRTADGKQWMKSASGKDAIVRFYADAGLNSTFQDLPQQERPPETERPVDMQKAMMSRDDFRSSQKAAESKADICWMNWELEGDCGLVYVACSSQERGTKAVAEVRAWLHPRLESCFMHFGVLAGHGVASWTQPCKAPDVIWPDTIVAVDDKAAQVPLPSIGDNVYGFDFTMPATVEMEDGEKKVEPSIPGVAFVFRTASGSRWIKQRNGRDIIVRFSSKGSWKGAWANVADRIVEQEVAWHNMSLKRRYENCLEFVDEWERQSEGRPMRKLPSWSSLVRVDSREPRWGRMPSMPLCDIPDEEAIRINKEEFWSWIFVWQRFSFMRLLTWERNTCTQPRMLAATTNQITNRMAELWKAHPRCRMWIRWTLSTMGRGGSAGQKIRDQILVIMHAHGIKEIHGTYYEQWHQKLHNNTTPEDIGICRAIITYLRTNGDMGAYWRVLHEHGITKERLASYSRPITTEPHLVNTDRDRLIHDFEDYLHILRSVHDALDLQLALDHARGVLPGSVQGKLQDICNMGGTAFNNLDEGHGKLMKISDARQEMLAMLNHRDTAAHVIKELLVIDYALETQQSVLIQGMSAETRLHQLADQLRVMLTSLVAHLPTEDELQAILADWMALAPEAAAQRWNNPTESALLMKAMSDRVSRVVGELSDRCQQLMGPKAAFLGDKVGASKQVILVFVDEVLRGTSLIAISLILQRLEPVLRELAHLPPWQMISAVDHPVQGELQLIDKMLHIQEKVFKTPTVLLSGAVSGEEEVPDGVVAVLVRSAKEAPDILSHCAVRARNFGVLLATCFDPSISAQIAQDFEGKWVQLETDSRGNVKVQLATRPTDGEAAGDSKPERSTTDVKVQMNLTDDLGCSWCIRPDEMKRANVGSKSLNLALLKPKLPSGILTPQAVALPFGCMQKALTDSTNKANNLSKLKDVLGALQPSSSNEEAAEIFEKARLMIQTMSMPAGLKDALKSTMTAVAKQDGEGRLQKAYNERDAWDAIKGVWASLFAIRPWVSLAKAGRSFHDLSMAVLVQELVEAKYAYVLHTMNPFTHDKDELYGELVAGRGESLVGNYPGRALSFVARRGEEPRLVAFPSKSVALHTQHCLIFRSDSNGEDLDGFAGAGLFESVVAQEDAGGFQRLHRLPVITDAKYRQDLLRRIAEVGWQTEKAFDGAPQDIEGCVDVNERIFIVQSRPQV